ncbi:RNA polymerase sigma factor RpoD/SigA [Acidobacteriota bacterium]
MPDKKSESKQKKSKGGPIVSIDPLRRYLTEIQAFESLTREEESEIATHYHETGDPEDAYRLVTANLRLVVKIAFQFRRTWTNLLDLIQEGNVGLMLAVKKFDPFRGVRLPSYAAWWIRAYIIKFILDNWKMVKVGTTNIRRQLLFNLTDEINKLERQGFKPEPKLLAERFGADVADIVAVQKSLSGPDISLDAPLDDSTSRSLYDVVASTNGAQEDEFLDKEFSTLVDEKLKIFAKELDEREQYILDNRLRSEQAMTLREIGAHFGVTREAIRQTETRLIRKLKEYMATELKEYAGVKFDIETP